jgi:hypothetical protein
LNRKREKSNSFLPLIKNNGREFLFLLMQLKEKKEKRIAESFCNGKLREKTKRVLREF